MNPWTTEQLAGERRKDVWRQRHPSRGAVVPLRPAPASRDALRVRLGWRLVAVGLRLAVPARA